MTEATYWALPVHCELGPARRWLRRRGLRRLWFAVVCACIYGVSMGLFLLMGSQGEAPSLDVLRLLLIVLVIGCFVASVALTVSATRWLASSLHGYPPRLRLTPRGIDVRCLAEHRYDLSVPWPEMDRLFVNRMGGRSYLCLAPKGPHRWIPADSRLAESVETCMRNHGTPFAIDLSLTGVSREELDRLVRHYSGGRFALRA